MNEEIVVKVDSLYKDFKLPKESVNSVKSIFTNFKSYKNKSYSIQHALKDVSFQVKKGEFFGIVGRNGSGKSTLLKTIAGIYQPTKGKISTTGKIVPFIELGVGFNPDLSGKDNVYLNGAMLGFNQKNIDDKYERIVEFAELKMFMNQKLKNYSSGMQVRLAFSVATILADSDILLLDEVLAVGDADFQRKCFDYFKNLKKQKKTVIFVSHDMNAVREYCDRAVLIEKSRIVVSGTAEKVASEYTKMFIDGAVDRKKIKDTDVDNRWGDNAMKFSSVKLLKSKIDDSVKNIVLDLELKANKDVNDPLLGFIIKNASGVHITGANNIILKKSVPSLKKNEILRFSWSIPNIFNDGIHYINTAAIYHGGTQTADWWEEAVHFTVFTNQKTPYLVNPEIKMDIKK